MATPATPSTQQRYTAGNCILDVDLQLSALSKWYPQPIAQDLQFELWMSTHENEEPVLLAQGDRTTLQALSQSISQQVRSTLAIAHLNQTAPPPSPIAISQPLSYLQLCDLQSVLYQCEQATRALPVALRSVESSVEESSVEAIAPQPAETIQTNNVISLSAARRRRRLWIGSAAAGALLTVGLSTAIWQNSSNDQQLTATVNREAERSIQEAEDSATDRELEAIQAEPSPSNATPSPPPEAGQGTSRQRSALPQESASRGRTEESIGDRTIEPLEEQLNPSVTDRSAADQPTSDIPVASDPPDIKPERSSGSQPDSSQPAAPPAPVPPPVSADEIPDIASAPPIRQPSAIQTERQAQGRMSELPESLASDLPSDSAAETLPAEAYEQRASASAEASDALGLSSALYADAVEQAIAQTQTYFQNRQQIIELSPSAPLIYQIQLSNQGRIVSFEAQSEAAEAEASNLQPSGLSLNLPAESLETVSMVTLRLAIAPNGQVQVTQAPDF